MGLFDWWSGSSSKDAARSSDIASQSQQFIDIINQGLAQLTPGSPEYNDLTAFGQKYLGQISQGEIPVPELGGAVLDQQPAATQYEQQLIKQQQDRIAAGGPANALESRTNLAIGLPGLNGATATPGAAGPYQSLLSQSANTPEEQAIFNAERGLPMSGQESPTGSIFADLLARAQNPDQYYQSTLGPQLALALQANQQAFGRRGLLGSGLQDEGGTRAANELAIQEAAARNQFRQQSMENFFNLFNTGEQLRNRSLGVAGDLVNLQLGRESNLTGLLGNQGFATANTNANVAGQNQAYARQDQLSQQQQDAAFQQMLGRLAGTGVGFALGGPTGAAIGGSVAGGGSNDLSSLLKSLQSPTSANAGTTGQPIDLSKFLSSIPTGSIY